MIPQISLDFETSGLNPYHDDIIEVAMKVVGKEETFTALLKPKSNECVSDEITHLTGITNKMLHIDGLPWKEVYQGVDKWLKGVRNSSPSKKIAIIAHNGDGFDFIFLKRIFYDLSLQNIKPINVKDIIFIDSLPLAKRLIPKRMSYRQETLCKTYNIGTEGNHRALNDVVALENLYVVLTAKLHDEIGKRRKPIDNPQMIHDYIHLRI